MRSMIFTSCIPQLKTVTSEIMPILSPKHAPPAIAQTVKIKSPPTRWFSHKKIGAHAANVPHDEPVATDKRQVTRIATGAIVRAVTPNFSAR